MSRMCLSLLLALWACSVSAQSVTIDALLATPFPTELTAAPTGARFAWVQSAEGVRNIWVAQAPDFKGRRITNYTVDDGQDLTELAFTGDGRFVMYTKGETANRQGESPNPTLMPDGAEQAVWAISADAAGQPKRLGPGRLPAPAPNGQRVAWVSRGQIWSVDLAAADAKAAQLVQRARQRAAARRGRPTARCSRSPAAAARTATSACSRSPTARAALHRSVARSRQQCGVVAGRIAHRVDSPGRRAARPRCSRRAAKSTSRGRCASPT